MTRSHRVCIWIIASAASLYFLANPFRTGWTHVETDFPNYYTAAVLTRHRMPLERFYDWPWFQRQMNYAGTERQLGAYVPQTPLTMAPMIPLSGLPPQRAKQVWLALNLVFLGLIVVMIARLTRLSAGLVLLLALLGYTSLASNFLLGQYYVFLLFLLTIGVWCLIQGRAFAGGFWMGVICMLKLYTAPFFLYFLWKRQWRALWGMLAACIGLGAASLIWFGWDANVYYVASVFARASENSILDPFHPATGTLTTLLRRTFVPEPELNPPPLFQAPLAFFLLRPFLTMVILVLPLLTLRRDRLASKRELAWFIIAILLSSPNTASYVFIILLLPIALLLENANWRSAVALIAIYVLLCFPLVPLWRWLFPKVWLLLVLYIVVGRDCWRSLRVRPVLLAIAVITTISALDAMRHQRSYEQEPARHFAAVASQPASIYASGPAISNAGMVFESIGAGGYVLNRELAFEGHAFHPAVPASGSPILFELVAGGHSRIMSFDPHTKALNPLTAESLDATNPAITSIGDRIAFISRGRIMLLGQGSVATRSSVDDIAWFPDGTHLAYSAGGIVYDSKDNHPIATAVPGTQSEPAVSPDGAWLALSIERLGIRHVWVQNLITYATREITGGACNSWAPAWKPDSKALIFASDCGRGLGLPRLYRAPLLTP